MYTTYFGLARKPFQLTPDAGLIFKSEIHQEALAILKYGVLSKKGFLVLTGDVGLGKTTLLAALVESLGVDIHLCLINNPLLSRDEFFSFIASKLDLPWDGNKAMLLIAFEQALKTAYNKGERILLIVDEAHVLPVDLLEELRLLSNLDVRGQDVLSIFLVGQPELNERMRDDRLLPLRQRIGIRFDLKPFGFQDAKQYILFRLRSAGARHLHLFTDEAISRIVKVSKGTPRLINIVCDHALLTAFAENSPVVNGDIINECIRDLHFPGEENPLPVATQRSGYGDLRKTMLIGLIIIVVICGALLLHEFFPSLVQETGAWLENMLPAEWSQKTRMMIDNLGGSNG